MKRRWWTAHKGPADSVLRVHEGCADGCLRCCLFQALCGPAAPLAFQRTSGLGALGLLAPGLLALPLPAMFISLFVLASGIALASPPMTSLTLADYPEGAGAAGPTNPP